MSRDDEFDYRLMFPIEGRTRKSRAANPRLPAHSAPKAVKKNVGQPSSRSQSSRGRSMDERPERSMGAVAREMIAKDLNQPLKEQCELLEAMGYEAPAQTIGAIRQEIFKVLLLCQKHKSIIIPAWDDEE